MKNFIKENNISFEPGSRNSSIVTLIGYSQFRELSIEELKEALSDEIEQDSFLSEEIDRLWDYCKARKYKDFWVGSQAKAQYTFS